MAEVLCNHASSSSVTLVVLNSTTALLVVHGLHKPTEHRLKQVAVPAGKPWAAAYELWHDTTATPADGTIWKQFTYNTAIPVIGFKSGTLVGKIQQDQGINLFTPEPW